VSALRSQCQCGCTLTASTGYIIASARQRCASNVRRWTIHVLPQYSLTLSVDYLRLSRLSSVRVYDSATSTTETGIHLALLLKLTNDQNDKDAAETVVTSGNRMLIEYVTVDDDVSLLRSNDGFIASYIATDKFTGTLLHYTTHYRIHQRGCRNTLVSGGCQCSKNSSQIIVDDEMICRQ